MSLGKNQQNDLHFGTGCVSLNCKCRLMTSSFFKEAPENKSIILNHVIKITSHNNKTIADAKIVQFFSDLIPPPLHSFFFLLYCRNDMLLIVPL